MIGYIKGIIIGNSSHSLTVNVNNLGYEIKATHLQDYTINQEIQLWITTKVSENDISLYGFKTTEEKKWFELLNSVSGIGPKTALTILNNLTIAQITTAILNNDTSVFKAISGIGIKNASRIIIELKEKTDQSTINLEKLSQNKINPDLVDVLVKFGYHKKEVMQVLNKLDLTESTDLIIKKAIKQL